MAGKTRGLFAFGAPASAMTAVGLVLAGSTFALDASPAKAYATPQTYDIPGGPMTDALNRLADMSGAQLAYDAALTRSIKSHGVSGKRTLAEALDELLAGTGLGYKFDPAGEYVAIMLAQNDTGTRNDAEAEALPAIDIGAERPRAVGPSNGKPVLTSQNSYVVPNSSTATKTDTPVMDTPINVQTITQKALEDQQATTLQQALQNVSGVSVLSGSDTFSTAQRTSGIVVRGFRTQEIYQDGVRISGAGASAIDITGSKQFANIGGIELLKGPAAVLYGLSEPGGVVNITTRGPQETPHYAVQQQIGALALYRTSLSATGPVASDKSVLYRVDMSYENNGAPFGIYIDGTRSRNFFVAPVVKWRIDNDTWVKAEVNYSNDLSSLYTWYAPTFNRMFLNLPRSNNYLPNSRAYTPNVRATLMGEHKFNEDWLLRSSVVFNSTNYKNVLIQGTSVIAGANPAVSLGTTNSVTLLSSWQTNHDLVGHFDLLGTRNTLLLGGDYSRFTGSSVPDYPKFGGNSLISLFKPTYPGVPVVVSGAATRLETYYRQDNAGLYLQDQVELPYGFHVMAGARYQYIYQESFTGTTGFSIGPTIIRPPALVHPTGDQKHQARVTPRFGLLWRPQSWVSLYGNYTEGFGANVGMIYPSTPSPPTGSESWEAGAKFELFDGRLRANIDYYSLIKTNVPIVDPDATHLCNGLPACVLVVGKVRSSGPEVDIQGELLPGWNVILNYTNQDVRVVDGGDSSGLQPGQRYPNMPRNLARLWTTYEFQDLLLKGLTIGGGYTYHGSQPVQGPAAQTIGAVPLLPSWGTVDLMAAYRFDLDGVKTTAQINATNIFDRTYYTGEYLRSALLNPGYTLSASRTSGPPFNIVGSLKFEF